MSRDSQSTCSVDRVDDQLPILTPASFRSVLPRYLSVNFAREIRVFPGPIASPSTRRASRDNSRSDAVRLVWVGKSANSFLPSPTLISVIPVGWRWRRSTNRQSGRPICISSCPERGRRWIWVSLFDEPPFTCDDVRSTRWPTFHIPQMN